MSTHLADLLARFDDTLPLAQARTIPASWYLDAEIADAERERVFGRCWLLVGRTSQVEKSGQFFTLDIGGEPILVVRGEDDVLRAFHNVCRHRAARVMCEESGCATRLRCRYHGWTYDLAGRLRGVPEFDGVADFSREDNGLPPLHVDVWAGFVWVHQGTPNCTLAEWVAPLARRGFAESMAPLHFVARSEYKLACDWKVYCDNYLDGGYHVNTVHPGLAGVLDYKEYRTELEANLSVQITPLTSKKGAEDIASVRGGDNAYYAWIFPNSMINIYEGLMDVNMVLPDGPGRCRVIFDYYFARTDDESRGFREASMAVTHQVQIEDVEICEEVQRNLRSRSYDAGRFSVRREAGGYHFHQLLARALRGS